MGRVDSIYMKKNFCLGLVLIVGLLLSFLSPALAQEPSFSPAFKTIGFWDSAKSLRVDVNIWYPTKSKPSTASFGPWRLRVVRYGKAAEGRFPLIVLSHDSAASRFSYHNTAAFLAASGFVVMAPEHKSDNLQRLEHNFQWQQLWQRMQEIRAVLDMAQSHDDVQSMVDMSRVGLLGFGTGATSALVLGGAMLDGAGWENYCVQVPQSTAYCNMWAQGHVEKMLKTLPPFGESFVDGRVKAVAAVSPKYDFLLTPKALQLITRPLLLVETEKDLNKKVWNAYGVHEIFPAQTEFFSVGGVDGRDLMALCPPALRKDLPDLCGTASAPLREQAHESLQHNMIHFFLKHLGQSAL